MKLFNSLYKTDLILKIAIIGGYEIFWLVVPVKNILSSFITTYLFIDGWHDLEVGIVPDETFFKIDCLCHPSSLSGGSAETRIPKKTSGIYPGRFKIPCEAA